MILEGKRGYRVRMVIEIERGLNWAHHTFAMPSPSLTLPLNFNDISLSCFLSFSFLSFSSSFLQRTPFQTSEISAVLTTEI